MVAPGAYARFAFRRRAPPPPLSQPHASQVNKPTGATSGAAPPNPRTSFRGSAAAADPLIEVSFGGWTHAAVNGSGGTHTRSAPH